MRLVSRLIILVGCIACIPGLALIVIGDGLDVLMGRE